MTPTLAPYCMTNDNIIMLLLIFNLVGIAYALLMNGAGILERTKCIFYYENKSTPYNDRTHITRICNALLDFQYLFYATIIATALVDRHCFDITALNSMRVTATLAAISIVFLLVKRGLHAIVNNILKYKNIVFFAIVLFDVLLLISSTVSKVYQSLLMCKRCVLFFRPSILKDRTNEMCH